MKYRFGIVLTMTMVAFAAMISFVISIFCYVQLREQAIENKLYQVRQNELMAVFALDSMEKAYQEFGNNITSRMEQNSYTLLDLYKNNPLFETWDFDALKQSLSSDVYIINDQNVIIHSNMEDEIGLDFKICCQGFSKVLDERRMSGQFFHDGIDIEQRTGMIKKYSYIGTPDKKFIIELGYSLEDDPFLRSFNFMNVIDQFAPTFPSIYEVNVLNSGGYMFGTTAAELPQERQEFFDHTRKTGETTEYQGVWDNEPAIYRYVQYISQYDDGPTKTKVLEIVYSDSDLQAILDENKKTFIIQLILILLSAVVISFVLTKWVATPLHYAFHDRLTGLKNRAALDELFKKVTFKSKGTTAVMMIDLDNFKLVNDDLGHDQGDRLLKHAAQRIRSLVRKEDIVVRLGGDEFVVIMPSISKAESEQTAKRMIDALSSFDVSLKDGQISASIGIALYPEHGMGQETLLKKADVALYASKEKGIGQYHVCE